MHKCRLTVIFVFLEVFENDTNVWRRVSSYLICCERTTKEGLSLQDKRSISNFVKFSWILLCCEGSSFGYKNLCENKQSSVYLDEVREKVVKDEKCAKKRIVEWPTRNIANLQVKRSFWKC
jgi:hypothetical protein